MRVLRPVLVAVVLTAGLAACGAPTPLCDQGATLAGTGQLSDAADAYARASEAGEGQCADAGLTAAGTRYTNAHVDVTRGRVAEASKDAAAAIAAYQAALTFDGDNAAARDGLARLGQPVPAFRPADPLRPPTPAPASNPSGLLVGLAIAAIVLLVAVLGLLGWVVFSWRRLPALGTASRGTEEEPGVRHAEVMAAVGELKSGLDEHRSDGKAIAVDLQRAVSGARSDLDGARKELVASAERTAKDLELQLDLAVDVIGEAVRTQGEPTHDHFARPGN